MSIVIITGGSRGLGASAAIQCAKRGMGVILTYNNNPEAAENVVRSIEAEGGKVAALKLDVGDSGSFAAFRATVRVTLGKVWESNLLSSFSSIHATSKELRVAMRRAAIMPGPPDAGRRHRPG